MDLRTIDPVENRRRMRDGELYWCFTDDLTAERRICRAAYTKFNKAEDASRREMLEMWKAINRDESPLPAPGASVEEDDEILENYPWVDSPVRLDYGFNVKLGEGVYVNANSTWIDTCMITVGARTLIGPNCTFISGSHPTDPTIRNGTRGPENGKPVNIGEDCWIAANCIILPGVNIGRGSTVGAGSVVTKDVPEYVVVVGNPARVLKKVEVSGQAPPA